jgi:2-methylisocitrate lyase-like PEP mutase family enzyme
MKSQFEKCVRFAELHQRDGAFLIPNPWDVGSAQLLESLGFEAIATTSAGLAIAIGCADGEVTLQDKLDHCTRLAQATSIPINADFENGFADDPSTVSKNLLRIAETGIAGCSIEDFSRDAHTLYDFNLAVERIQAAVEAVRSLAMPFQLTARAENLLRGVNDIDDTIKRLQAFSAAGADVLYAPGLSSLAQVQQVTAEIDKPFNVLAAFFKDVSVADFSGSGAKRISVGSALSFASINPLLIAGREMLEQGTFNWMAGMASRREIDDLMSQLNRGN